MKKVITIQGQNFINQSGEKIILNGLNIVCKSPSMGFIFEMGQTDWERLARWKVNVVRFGINWSGLEPLPGQIDSGYLDRIEEQVDAFQAHGIPVFLDMHQDLFSIRYSNGAPFWATMSHGQHVRKGEWYHAYHLSEAVQTATDAFWANTPAADGVGLTDHFAAVWKAVAKRFANHPNVIGYDMYNEPIQGSPCRELGRTLIQGLAEWYGEKIGRTVTWEEAYGFYFDQQRYHAALPDMTSDDLLKIQAKAFPFTEAFDTLTLQPFYEKVATAIREVDQDSLLFVCNSNQTNNGTASALKPLVVNGKRDPNQVFAPHAYDLICDAPVQNAYSQARVDAMFIQHKKLANKYAWPMLAGEWGAFPRESYTSCKKYRDTRTLFERLDVSQTYWDYQPGTPVFFFDEVFGYE